MTKNVAGSSLICNEKVMKVMTVMCNDDIKFFITLLFQKM